MDSSPATRRDARLRALESMVQVMDRREADSYLTELEALEPKEKKEETAHEKKARRRPPPIEEPFESVEDIVAQAVMEA